MIIDFHKCYGGGGSGSGVTPQEVQAQIDSALTPYWDSAATESAITEAVEGKADSKTIVDFDHTTQAERASIYAELKALYDAGSGATINKNYDFYKTVNTWQGLKIDYYSFSADTLVFGKVVSPENLTDQVVYEQVMTIDSAGTVAVVTNTVGGGGDMSGYYTSAQTDEKIASAVTPVANHLAEVEQVTASALTELHDGLLEVSAATSGKADAASVTANTTMKFPLWNEQGVITGTVRDAYDMNITINGSNNSILRNNIGNIGPIYAPTTPGNAGDILVSTGRTPVWSAMTFPTPDVTKAYVDSADTALQDQIDTMDEVVSAALVDLEGKKVESQDIRHMVKLTQAQYDALVNKDPYTFYIIVSN